MCCMGMNRKIAYYYDTHLNSTFFLLLLSFLVFFLLLFFLFSVCFVSDCKHFLLCLHVSPMFAIILLVVAMTPYRSPHKFCLLYCTNCVHMNINRKMRMIQCNNESFYITVLFISVRLNRLNGRVFIV